VRGLQSTPITSVHVACPPGLVNRVFAFVLGGVAHNGFSQQPSYSRPLPPINSPRSKAPLRGGDRPREKKSLTNTVLAEKLLKEKAAPTSFSETTELALFVVSLLAQVQQHSEAKRIHYAFDSSVLTREREVDAQGRRGIARAV
jgi:hypothetical protein